MALVTQRNIPQSGQIKKPRSIPSAGNSKIQQHLENRPEGQHPDNFPNNQEGGKSWHSTNHRHALNNNEGWVKFGHGIPTIFNYAQPELGDSFIQIGTFPTQISLFDGIIGSPATDDFPNNRQGAKSWHSVDHTHALNNGLGWVKYGHGIPDITDNFPNPTPVKTWQSEAHTHTSNNSGFLPAGEGKITYGVGIPTDTKNWTFTTTNQSIEMKYSPVEFGKSRIQKNFDDIATYEIMSADEQRNWSGMRTAGWLSEPHLVMRPHQKEDLWMVDKGLLSAASAIGGAPLSLSGAVLYTKHLASPRGLQFLNAQNVAQKRNAFEHTRTVNPLAFAVSRGLPVQMNRHGDTKYSKLVDILTGGTPLRSLAIEGLSLAAASAKINLPAADIVNKLKAVDDGELKLGGAVQAVVVSYAEGKAIDYASSYGQKLMDKWNAPAKEQTPVAEPPAEPGVVSPYNPVPFHPHVALRYKAPYLPIPPSKYGDHPTYTSNFIIREDQNLWGGKNEQDRTNRISIGTQMIYWHMGSVGKLIATRNSSPAASVEDWKTYFEENGIRYRVEKNEQSNEQWGYDYSGINSVGREAEVYGPGGLANGGAQVKYTTAFPKGGINTERAYPKIKTEGMFENRQVQGSASIGLNDEVDGPDDVGTLIKYTHHDTIYPRVKTQEMYDANIQQVTTASVDKNGVSRMGTLSAPDEAGLIKDYRNDYTFVSYNRLTAAASQQSASTQQLGSTSTGLVSMNNLYTKDVPYTRDIDTLNETLGYGADGDKGKFEKVWYDITKASGSQQRTSAGDGLSPHVLGKTADASGSYSVGGTETLDKYKAHLYGDIKTKRNDSQQWYRIQKKDNQIVTLVGKHGVPGINGDKYQIDVMNTEDVSIQDLSNNKAENVPDDLITFKIKIINTNELIVLRAYISDISDAVTPNWSSINYVGRPDPVYIYKGAERKFTLKWTMVANAKEEHEVMWKKANKLIGLNYPSYADITTSDGTTKVGQRMVPPMIKLTVGDYISDQPGYFENINITPVEGTKWEIEKGSQLPHVVEVNASFVYIGDSLPDLGNPKFINVDGAQKTTA